MSKYKLIGLLALLALLVYFPVFLHLTDLPVRVWDEARLSVNAYEMAHSGNLLVVKFEGSPEMWSTKPPLMIWLQAICIKIFGFNEFSIRFPSALSAVFTFCVLFIFCYKFIKSYTIGICAVLVLLTSGGYIDTHVSRTGDYDSLLTLLSTTSLLCFFIFTETEGKQSDRFLLLFFIVVTLGVLCKGVAIIMFAPALVLYVIARGKAMKTIRNRNFLLGTALFIVFGIGYYFLREIFNHGYLQAVWENELGGRYLQALEGHEQPFWYYYWMIIEEHFQYWYLLVPCGVLVGVASRDKRISNLAVFLAIAVVQFFLVISWGQTKLPWYDAPLFPLLALLVAIFLGWVLDILNNNEVFKMNLKFPVAAITFLFLIFIRPYCGVFNYSYFSREDPWEAWAYKVPLYLRRAVNDNINVNGYLLVYSEYRGSILFYEDELLDKGQHVSQASIGDLKINDTVITSEDKFYQQIEKKFNVELLKNDEGIRIYRLLSLK